MKKKRKSLEKFIVVGICSLVVLGTGRVYLKQSKELKELEQVKVEKEKEKKKIQNEIRMVEKEIENKDSLEFVEKVAREDYNMVKPREIIYIDKNKDKREK